MAMAEVTVEEGVLVLTDANFDEEVAKHEFMLLELYAPWCGHCKKLAPEYAKAAQELEGSGVVLAKVDATEEKGLASRFGVQGFPTLKWLVNGQPQDYTGGRDQATIVSWVRKASGPASQVHECHEVDAEAGKHRLTAVYKGDEATPLFEQFMKVAKDTSINSKFEFKHAHGCDAHGVALHRQFDEPVVHFNGEHTAEALVQFLVDNSVATLIKFGPDEIENVFGSQKASMFLFTQEDEESHLVTEVSKAAKELKGDIQFVISGVTDGFEKKVGEFFDLTAADLPKVIFLNPANNMKKHHVTEDVSNFKVDDFRQVLDKFRSGAIPPHVKSAPVPTEQGPVFTIVGSTHDQVTSDSSKDVFVKYYAPWCGHCKKLAPIWVELAEHFAGVEDLVIAEHDATENDTGDISISGYPTLYWFPKNGAPQKFEGGRDFDALLDFVNKKSESAAKHHAHKKHDEL